MSKENYIDMPVPIVPIDYTNIIEDFFDSNINYVKNLQNQILNRNDSFPYIQLRLVDIMIFDERLYKYIKMNPEKAIEYIRKVLLNKAKLSAELNDFLMEKERCRFESINLSFDLEEVKEDIPLYDNFSLGTKPFVDKLIRIRARFLELKIFRDNVATKISYECVLCGKVFEIVQFKGKRGKYRVPNFCIERNCKAKGFRDFKVKGIVEYNEVGYFRIGEIDFSKQNEKECYTFCAYDYFSKKAQDMNVNDIIEIIGIIELDYSDIGTRTEDQKIHEIIKVIDFTPIELKTTDSAIIKELYKIFKKDANYHHQILDSIHPITRGIYTFRIFKLINLLSICSADSWDTVIKNRCSINFIVGSNPSLFKGSIVSEFRGILGANNVGRLSGQDSTPKAFVPTSQRGKDSDFQVRFGSFAYYHRRFLVVDESQAMLGNKELRKPIKYLEEGYIDRGSDGTVLHAEAKLSVGFLMNYVNEEQDEGYNYGDTLRNNLGGIEGSTLQRLDLHYAMHNPPTQITDILEKRMFRKDDRDISVDIIYNYINEVKRIYPIQKISKSMEDKIIAYMRLLRTKRDIKRQNIRESRTLIRLLCGISAIRLKTEIDESDLVYLQKHLVNLMIPFFESKSIRKLKLIRLDMNEVYQNTVKLLAEIRDEIPIYEHISLIRHFLKSHYFPGRVSSPKKELISREILDEAISDSNDSVTTIDDYMPSEANLSNYKYRGLFENKENMKYIESIGYVIGKKKDNKTYFIKINYLNGIVLNRVKEIFKDNKNKQIYYDGVIQVLGVDVPYERDLIIKSIKYHIKNKNLMSSGEKISFV